MILPVKKSKKKRISPIVIFAKVFFFNVGVSIVLKRVGINPEFQSFFESQKIFEEHRHPVNSNTFFFEILS